MTHRGQRGGTSPMAADLIARPAAAGTVELANAHTRLSTPAEDGCGNGAAMEITERFPPPLGNLAQNARFPHSHSRVSDFDKNKDQDTHSIRGPRATLQRRC
jgi:hypothetical protein